MKVPVIGLFLHILEKKKKEKTNSVKDDDVGVVDGTTMGRLTSRAKRVKSSLLLSGDD